MALVDGLYDLLLTEGIARSFAELEPGTAGVMSLQQGASGLLVDFLVRQLGAILDDIVGDDAEVSKRQLKLAKAGVRRPAEVDIFP